MPRRSTLAVLCLLLALGPLHSHAQAREGSLSDSEVEELREAAYVPNDRVTLYIKILDTRIRQINDLVSKPRRPGREEDLHDLFEQFTSIAGELNDNLDDFGPRHRDLRKSLPKLLQGTDRWATALRSPSDQDIDKLSRSLALEAVKDLHDDTTKLVDEQKTYFTAHPEAAKAEKDRIDTGSSHPASPEK